MRADLQALTSESVASLSNVGLVKRALREWEAGQGPVLEELDDGTVVGTFQDGAVTRLPVGLALKDVPCSCGAAKICRHRVAVALGYAAWRKEHAPPDSSGPASAAPSVELEAWWPGELDDVCLERALGEQRLTRARALLTRGLLVTLEAGTIPVARLPSCTVRFLVPHDVAYARCDCVEQSACEHVALAVWAFRAQREPGVLALGGRPTLEVQKLESLEGLWRELVFGGVARMPSLAVRFATERQRVAGLVWLESLLVDLEQALDGWRARSARFSLADVRALVVELVMRLRAADGAGELPVRHVLGQDEASVTLLDHVRLISLGARLEADGLHRFAEVFLADPDTSTVLVLRKRWDDAADDGPALARRVVAARIRLGDLARGQLVSKAVQRAANRSIELKTSSAQQTAVLQQSGDWSSLRAPVRIDDLQAHLAAVAAQPPPALRPRVLAEHLHAVTVARVCDVYSLPAEQAALALLEDPAGNRFQARVTHRTVAPYALAATAAALSGPVRFVSGELRSSAGGVSLALVGIATDTGLVVPDLSGPTPAPTLAPLRGNAPVSPHHDALRRATGVLDELLMSGLGAPEPNGLRGLVSAAANLRNHGLGELAQRLEQVATLLPQGRLEAATAAWADAAVRTALTVEVLGATV